MQGMARALGALLFVGWSLSAARSETYVLEDGAAFRVEVPAEQRALAPELLRSLQEARRTVAHRAGVPLGFTARVVWCESTAEFIRQTGQTAGAAAAAQARPSPIIWINGPAWRRSGTAEAFAIAVHEYAHLLIGSLNPGVQLPRWANEGLAMHLSGEWTLAEAWRAVREQLFGGLPDLAAIETDFPTEPNAMSRAYLASYLAIEHLARQMGAKPENVDVILERLRDARRGTAFAEGLWTPEVRGGVQADSRAALGSTARKWVIVLTSGTTLWMIITAMFFFAYYKKRREIAAAKKREQREDAWAESLTQKDIEEIYGAPEDGPPEEAGAPRANEDDADSPWKSAGESEELEKIEEDDGESWKRR